MNESYTCNYCKSSVTEADDFCPNCKYPLKGTEKEKSIFIGQQVLKKGTISDAKIVRKNASYILLFIGIVNLLVPMIRFLISSSYIVEFIIGLIIGVLFIVLSFKARKVVYYPFIIGIIFLLFIYIINGIIQPESIIAGISWKIFYLGGLTYGIYLTYQEKLIKKEHKNLN
jgi:hypothetical protein